MFIFCIICVLFVDEICLLGLYVMLLCQYCLIYCISYIRMKESHIIQVSRTKPTLVPLVSKGQSTADTHSLVWAAFWTVPAKIVERFCATQSLRYKKKGILLACYLTTE